MKTTSKKKEYGNIINNIYIATNILMNLELIMKFKAYLQTERVDALARKLVAQR